MRGAAVPGGPERAAKAADAAVACPPLEGIDLGTDDLPMPHPQGSPVRSQSASFAVATAAGAMACAGAPGACRAR